jgi:DNA-binding NarL/FixJ family response regulator
MISSRVVISPFVIARHKLAGRYLIEILLKDRQIKPLYSDQLPKLQLKDRCNVFVLENPHDSMPLTDSVRKLRSASQTARFIIVDEQRSDEELVQMMRIGIHGYVPYPEVAKTLCNAVRKVAAGELWIKPRILQSSGRPRLGGVISTTRLL